MGFDGFHLMRPEALWLALLVPLFLWLLRRDRGGAGNWSRVVDPALLPHLLTEDDRPARRTSRWLVVAAVLLGVIAIAGPSVQKIDVPVFQRADALVVVLDLSASMAAADVQPSRAQRARQKIRDLLAQRTEGVTGLVVYAGDAHVVAPLTDDVRTIENLLPALTPSIMPLPGSDPTGAIKLAVSLLGAAGAANGQLLLMTDGMPKFDPADVADTLAENRAALSILGIGTESGAPIPLPDGGFVRDSDGDIVVPILDTDTLAAYARALGGPYSTISLDNSDLDRLTGTTGLLDTGDIQLDRKTDTWLDQGNWLALVLGLGLLPLFRRGALALVLISPLLGSVDARAEEPGYTGGWATSLWRTPDQQGLSALEQGDADTAATLFERPDWRGTAQYQAENWLKAADSFGQLTDDADSLYNRGNALARGGEYEKAIDAYERSLELDPEREDALHNRDLVRQLLEQQSEENNPEGDDSEQSEDSNDSDGEDRSGDQDQNDASGEQGEGENNPSPESNESGQTGPESEGNRPPGDDAADSATDPSKNEGQLPGADSDQTGSEEDIAAQTEAQMAKFDQALEKQQALEQWLRRVPDDPGGLLQRKFRYESYQRLRRGEEPDDDVRW